MAENNSAIIEERVVKESIYKMWAEKGVGETERYCKKIFLKHGGETKVKIKALILKTLIMLETELESFDSALWFTDLLIKTLKEDKSTKEEEIKMAIEMKENVMSEKKAHYNTYTYTYERVGR